MTEVSIFAGYDLTIGGNTKRSKTGQHKVNIDFGALPPESQTFIVRYGLKQYLADGMAGATTEAEAAEGVNQRVAKLLAADFTRTRGESGPTDDEATLAKQIAREEIRTALKAKGVKLPKERVGELVDALFTRDETRLRKEAAKRIADRKKAAEALSLDDILGDIVA